jgi:hypothetical protein
VQKHHVPARAYFRHEELRRGPSRCVGRAVSLGDHNRRPAGERQHAALGQIMLIHFSSTLRDSLGPDTKAIGSSHQWS